MNHLLRYITVTLFLFFGLQAYSEEIKEAVHPEKEKAELNVTELIIEHLADNYEWHITTFGHTHVSIPLPVIVKGKTVDGMSFLHPVLSMDMQNTKDFI